MFEFYIKKFPLLFGYLIATFLSKIGNKMYIIILPIIIYDLTGSATLMGGTFFFQTLPTIVLSPFAGGIIDTISKRKVMIFSIVIQMGILLVLYMMLNNNALNTWLLFALAFLISAAGIFYSISNESILPEISHKDDWIKINSHFQIIDTLSFMIGPSVAGVVISIWGTGRALIIDIITFLPLLLVLMLFRKLEVQGKKIRYSTIKEYWKDQKKGWFEIFNNKMLLAILAISTAANFANGIVESMFIFFAKEELHLSSTYIGLVFTIAAFVSLLVGLYAQKIASKMTYQNILLYTKLVSGIGVFMIAFSPVWYVLSFSKSLFEGPTILSNIVNRTTRQKLVPIENLGKVNAFYRMFVISSFSLSGLFAGILTDYMGLKNTFLLAGSIFIIIFIFFYLNGSLKKLDQQIR
jgi:MFS transporter, DHA3 family, macrolide efflux protein